MRAANTLRGLRADFSRYDVVHCFGAWPAAVYALAFGGTSVPVVIHEHLSPPSRLADVGVLGELRTASAVVCPSAAHADMVSSLCGRSVSVVPNPVEVGGPFSLPARENVVAYGRLVEQKGFDLFCEAAVELRPRGACFALYGDGPERKRLEAMARYPGTVAICRSFPPAARARVLASAAVVVCPSRHESFGLACAEAVGHGVPVVATNVGEHANAAGPAGVVWCNGPLSAAIEDALNRKVELRERAAKQRVVVAERYSPARFLDGMDSVYEACMDSPERRSE